MTIDAVVAGIIGFLKAKGRLDWLAPVGNRLIEASTTVIDQDLAVVTTPVALTADQKQRLKSTLSRLFDRPVKLTNKLDSRLVAGMSISLGGRLIDATIDRRLKDLGEKLRPL